MKTERLDFQNTAGQKLSGRLELPDGSKPVAFALFALSFWAIPRAPGHWFVALPVALFGVAQGMNYPVVMSLLAGRASTEHRAIFMSVNGMVLRVGQTLGPLIMAGVAAAGGIDQVFYTAMGICGVLFLAMPWILRGE